jgi:hypothetical protein
MKTKSAFTGWMSLVLAALVIAGCANQMEPAKKAIDNIEAAVAAAGPDAEKYVPDELHAVQQQLSDLKAKFAQKDYKAVLAAGPALLTRAQGLASAAASAKETAVQALTTEWSTLAADVPKQLAAVQSRIAMLSKSRKLPAGLDKASFEAAKSSAAEAQTTWNQATAAQAAGNLDEAVTAARQVKDKLNAAMSALGMSTG